jgi:DNA polymerase-1
MQSKALIIDGYSLAFRAFYALPLMSTPMGIYTNAVYGFATMLQKALDVVQPEYALVAFDRAEPTFRHQEFEAYKGTRQKAPPELLGQFSLIHDLLDAMNIPWLEIPGFEADDLLGSLGHRFAENNIEAFLLTGDRDAYQLISPGVKVLYSNRKGMSDLQVTDEAWILEQYALKPVQLIDVKALMGDASDNIPGVPSIGEKTALKLVQQFGSLESILERVSEVEPKRARENLITYRDQAYLSYRLAKIITDVEIKETMDHWQRRKADITTLREFYQRYALKSLLDKLPAQVSPEPTSIITEQLTLPTEILSAEACLKKIKQGQLRAMTQIETAGGLESALLELGFLFKDESRATLPIHDEHFLMEIGKNLESHSFSIWDVKKTGHLFNTFFRQADDLMLQAYLLNPGQELSIDHVYQDLFPEVEISETAHLDKALSQMKALLPRLEELLKERNLWKLYKEIELPLARVLFLMEDAGIGVRLPVLQDLSRTYQQKIESLQERIIFLAGTEFNLNSPKQLAEILFEKLGLSGGRKTKSGYSTDADTLERLEGEHEIIGLILQYRGLTKLKGTYLDGLIPLIEPTRERLHTTFGQAVTTTGRLSSSDPNLQNIPTRSEEGRLIRKAFYPTVKGWRLVSADYSQIELRILAHLSQDEHFIDAYKNQQDIHRRTASEVFDIPFQDVSSALRDKAKAVNFGIVYGISDYGLATQLRISRKEAQGYIDRFFEEFPAIRDYQTRIIEDAKEQGYVTTIFQRRRYLPEILSKNYNLRSFGERAALNTPIQGSAADLIKIAMIRLQEAIETNHLKARILLQVHDELVCETHPEEEAILKKIMKTTMEEAISLSVPIIVEVYSGDNWYDLQK